MISEVGRKYFKATTELIAKGIVRTGIHPNWVTFTGFILTSIGSIELARARFDAAFIYLGLGAICDMLDGTVARLSGKIGIYGAFLDSTLDRYSEIVFHVGLLVLFLEKGTAHIYNLLVLLSIVGSILVSYVKARAEGLGQELKGGLMERPERVILSLLGVLLAHWFNIIPLLVMIWILAITVHFTAMQRIFYLRNKLNHVSNKV